MHNKALIDQIDNLLPQTQCGECSYPGCLPYATAIVTQGEKINRCPPGGQNTVNKLAELLKTENLILDNPRIPSLANIREDECIGCTKCIQACPVDAIIGAPKQMHEILFDECTGCGLCVAPCPVDCIDLVPIEKPRFDKTKARFRFEQRQSRQKPDKPQSISADKQAYIQAALARVNKKHE